MSGIATAIVGSAVLGVGAAVLSGQATKSAADAASNASLASANLSANTQLSEFNAGQAATAPWRSQGQAALYNLSDLAGVPSPTSYTDAATGTTVTRTPQSAQQTLENTPGYQVQLDALNQALMRGGMGSQNYGSGNFWDSVLNANQQYASTSFNNVYNQLAGLAGTGQVSAGQTAGLATSTGAGMGSAYTTGGQGAAAATLAGGAGQSSMYNNLASQGNNAMNNYLFYNLMQNGLGSTPTIPTGQTQYNDYSSLG